MSGRPGLSGSGATGLSGIGRLGIACMGLAALSCMSKSFSWSDQSLPSSGRGRMGWFPGSLATHRGCKAQNHIRNMQRLK
ncbi:MAG: hypothetical protein ACLR0U_19360 [Enterocloster clostridioformis]